MIAVGDERHRRDAHVEKLAALLELQGRARLGQMARDIAHGDGSLQAWREATAGDATDFITLAVEDQRAFANWLAAFDVEADALLGAPLSSSSRMRAEAGESHLPLGGACRWRTSRPAITGVVVRSMS